MSTRLPVWWMITAILVTGGCDRANRAELERTRAELDKTRAELSMLNARLAKLGQDVESKSYLEELEKLDSLKTKGVLTEEEFGRRKQAILESQKLSIVIQPEPPASGMDELAGQLRTLASLYSNSTINQQERDAKKAQLIGRPLHMTNMKKDLETVQDLYNESAITQQERDTLKQKLLELDTK
jgi:multidrug resistance efflux pump